jgi:hypothetical protein
MAHPFRGEGLIILFCGSGAITAILIYFGF